MSKRKSTSNNGEQLSRKTQSASKSSNSSGKKRSLPINISIESDEEKEMDDEDALPSTSTEITNQSSSAPSKDIPQPDSVPSLKRKPHSWVWKHATLIKVTGEPDKYSCLYCDKKFLRNGTGVISRHLKNKHSEKLKTDQQCTLTSPGKVVAPFKFDSDKSHQLFLQFIVANNHSFSLGEEHAFRLFVASLQPLHKPLSRTSVKNKLMSTFINARAKVTATLQDAKVALTTDLWTSPNKLAFMGITASYLTKQFKPIEVIIGFKHLLGEHSGMNIGDSFYDTIKLYDLQERVRINHL